MREFITSRYTACYAGHLLAQGIGKNIVAGIGGILFAPGVVVGRSGINGVAHAGREGNLGHQKRFPTRVVNVYVDVRCPTGVPTGENAGETHLPIGIRYLTTAQEMDSGEIGLLHTRATVFGVVAVLVAMPDVDNRSSQRFAAGIEVFDVDFDTQGYTSTIRADVNHLQGSWRFGRKRACCFRWGNGASSAGTGIIRGDFVHQGVFFAGVSQGYDKGYAQGRHAFFQKFGALHVVGF